MFSDYGEPQKWLRSWRALPTGQNNLKRTTHHSLQIDCETGVGLNGYALEDYQYLGAQTGAILETQSGDDIILEYTVTTGANPQLMMRWSDDGGHTWTEPRTTSMGRIGRFGTRAIFRRLGMTTKLRDRVYEISATDPVKVAIIGAELEMSGTNA